MSGRSSPFAVDPIPDRAGIGLRHTHIRDFLESPPATGWVEVHSENYLAAGGARLAALETIRRDFPLSCHGVGLSLGSAEGLDRDHLARLRALNDRFQPGLVSEHVSWSVTGGTYLNDLLPLPYTPEALDVLCRNIGHAQEALGRQILVENPSTYVRFTSSTMPEWEFMAEIARRTGCGLLLDVNNIHVSAFNHQFEAEPYLDAVPLDAVQEIHVAGHFVQEFDDQTILIDDHGAPVDEAVWALFRAALDRLGPIPTLVEWDTRIPPLPVLLAEARKADILLNAVRRRHGGQSHVA
ncbi:MAG: MNIO family bufferin maturase [Inquilinaceae bacterium]